MGRDGPEKNRPAGLDLQGIPMFGAVHTAQTLSTYNFFIKTGPPPLQPIRYNLTGTCFSYNIKINLWNLR